MKAEVGYYQCAATDVSGCASRCFMPAHRDHQSTIGEAMKIDE
jgi:hypothetical protein